MDPILTLPLATINPDALPRDRSTLDPAALEELQLSIATDGLRQPIEVWKLSAPTPEGHDYGLISGLRRLTAHRNLNRLRPGGFASIQAILRTPASIAEAMAAMISENEVRSPITPWDRGRILVQSVQEGIFDSVEAATKALHPAASKQKRSELRSLAHVVDELDGQLTTPEALSLRKMLQLSAALRGGLCDLIRHILSQMRGRALDAQWDALLPTLAEASRHDPEIPATAHSPARPRRLLHLRQGLTLRRELSADGWLLFFSGDEARKGALMEDVMDYIERTFQPGIAP